ncbi:alpha/beta fold hydrolase [Rhodobacter calidifons]|uniref:Alpha/beta fold hydrolase n=1 Tax=Rhodobacter calidifons TaxID=2715277 RepID=A0ABX0G3S5_9RHOB|nr:alpha/beta fold hydrolase [Rhodobacter calidifons]NHB75880.1 alpha/beta fold hydrolase [Rhodobacter calidifons]
MGREIIQLQGHVPHAPEDVWRVVRDFSGAWHPWVATIREERGAKGARIRAFTVAGEDTTYREQLTYSSDSDRVLGYTHLEGIRDCEAYDARVTVSPAEAGRSVVGWTATVRAPTGRLGAICEGTKRVFEAGIAALGDAAAIPFPRPLRSGREGDASGPDAGVRLETLVFDDLPRLALSIAAAPPPPSPTRGEGGSRLSGSGAAASAARLPSPLWGGEGGGRRAPGGRLCLFLHGIGGGRSNWEDQLRAVGGVMRAAALDLLGYGDSSLGARQSTVDDYCADILRVAERLGATRLVLVGLSYGSWIATSFAMRHPEMLDALVLSGGCTGMSEAGPDEREAFRVSREVPLTAGQTPADFAPAVVKVLASPGASEAVRQRLFDSMAAIPAATYRDALTCFTNPLERFDFSRLTMPVLLLTGEHDRLAPPSEIRGVAGRIWDLAPRPDVRFEVIAGAGHVCNVEAPAAYNRPLLDLLERLP